MYNVNKTIQVSLQLQWFAVMIVNIVNDNPVWRPCCGMYVDDQWFLTSLECIMGKFDHQDKIGGMKEMNYTSIGVASGFFSDHHYVTNLYYVADILATSEARIKEGPYGYWLHSNGSLLMVHTVRKPYHIAMAPLMEENITIDDLNNMDCYLVGYDDDHDKKIYPEWQPQLLVLKLDKFTNCKECQSRDGLERFDFCSEADPDIGVCIHDSGAALVCNNIVYGILYRSTYGNCPFNERGYQIWINNQSLVDVDGKIKESGIIEGRHCLGFMAVNKYLPWIDEVKQETQPDLYELVDRGSDLKKSTIPSPPSIVTWTMPSWDVSTFVDAEIEEDYHEGDDQQDKEEDLRDEITPNDYNWRSCILNGSSSYSQNYHFKLSAYPLSFIVLFPIHFHLLFH